MNTRDGDAFLRLARPGGRARFWLFALTFVLPVLLAAIVVAMSMLGDGPQRLVAGSLPLTVAATVGGVGVLCGALYWILGRFMDRQALVLSADSLEVRSSFYRCRTPLHELKLEQARIVDLDEHAELRPMLKTNGFGVPGFRSGWFLLRNRRRSFVAIADGRRRLWLPGSGKHDLLLEPVDPTALLSRLRELAGTQGRG